MDANEQKDFGESTMREITTAQATEALDSRLPRIMKESGSMKSWEFRDFMILYAHLPVAKWYAIGELPKVTLDTEAKA